MIKNDLGEILCDQNAANYLNDHYVNIGEVLAEKFGSNTWNPGANFPSQNMETFNFRMITEKESLSLIKQIDVSKSSAISEIKAIFIKDAFLSLNFEVTYLLNVSLRKGDFPDEWGHSFVTPIPEEGDHLEPGNWKPISQMPIIGRLIEKAIHSQMRYFIDSTGLLHRNQHGFRTGKSTGSAIFNYTKELYSVLDNNQLSISTHISIIKKHSIPFHMIYYYKNDPYMVFRDM